MKATSLGLRRCHLDLDTVERYVIATRASNVVLGSA
jgi:hypothetical protein